MKAVSRALKPKSGDLRLAASFCRHRRPVSIRGARRRLQTAALLGGHKAQPEVHQGVSPSPLPPPVRGALPWLAPGLFVLTAAALAAPRLPLFRRDKQPDSTPIQPDEVPLEPDVVSAAAAKQGEGQQVAVQLDPTAPGVAIVGLSELQELNQEQLVAVQLDPTAPGVAMVGLSELQELNQEPKAGGSPSINKGSEVVQLLRPVREQKDASNSADDNGMKVAEQVVPADLLPQETAADANLCTEEKLQVQQMMQRAQLDGQQKPVEDGAGETSTSEGPAAVLEAEGTGTSSGALGARSQIDLQMIAGGVMRPHPDKVEKGGEDAFFTCTAQLGAAGVADGVGGWVHDKVDPALYARRLMEGAAARTRAGEEDAREVLVAAIGGAEDVPGSATVCVAVMRGGGRLEVANLGDSGFRIFREHACVFASTAQQHQFNLPYQAASVTLNGEGVDSADDADVYGADLLPGDLLLLGTDGLFDNLFDYQLEALLAAQNLEGPLDADKASEVAEAFVAAAARNSANPKFRSPWVTEAAKAGVLPIWKRMDPLGGKLDDITAVFCFVVAVEESSRG